MLLISPMGMRGIFSLSMICISMAGTIADAYCSAYNIFSDTVFNDSGEYKFDSINVNNSVFVHNQGALSADFYIADNVSLTLKNSGNIHGTFYLGENAELTQIISSPADVTFINVAGNFNIVVSDANNIPLNALMNSDADHITIHDSSLVLYNSASVAYYKNSSPAIEISGNVNIFLSNNFEISDIPVLSNLSGIGNISVYAYNNNPLYKILPNIIDGNLYLSSVRETDYTKILNDPVGGFINTLRDINPRDPLVTALDNAGDLNAINDIISDSVSVNPINIMRPVRAINSLLAADRIPDDPGMEIQSLYIVSDTINGYGIFGRGHIMAGNNTNIAIAGYSYTTDYDDDINMFSVLAYGGNIKVFHRINDTYSISAVTGATFAESRTGPILNKSNITRNPAGISLYGRADITTTIYSSGITRVMPFAGIGYDRATVLSDTDFNLTGHIGIDTEYSFEIDGIIYKSDMRIGFDTSGNINANGKISFKSVMDNIGGDIGIGVIRYDDVNGIIIRTGISVGF